MTETCEASEADAFARRLETEGLILLGSEPFRLDPAEKALAEPGHGDGRAKNISLGPDGELRGASADAEAQQAIGALMRRYRAWAQAVVRAKAPRYDRWLETGRTSLRTREVSEGAAGPRKDDRRLHVDAFASQPTGGKRILRVFTNIDPTGGSRVWRVGEPFAAYAQRWAAGARRALPGEAWLLSRLGITRAERTPYDTLMLALHDAAKLDETYQRTAPAREVAFPAGASWMVYTDSVVHAAIAGRGALEQTFYLPLQAMAAPDTAPAHILEEMMQRRLT
jgi:hypothetical protein